MRFTIAQQLFINATAYPNRIAIDMIDGESITYGELMQRSIALARDIGPVPDGPNGPMLAFLMGNGIEPILAYIAGQILGCTVVPINTRFAHQEILHVLRDSGSTVLLTSGDQYDEAKAAAEEANVRLMSVTSRPVPQSDVCHHSDIMAANTDISVIFYTSGTTGFPKGAVITLETWVQRLLWWGWEFELSDEDVVFTPGPLFHMGFSSVALCALMRGARLRILARYDAVKAFNELRFHCTWSLLIPTMTTMMVEHWRLTDRTPLLAAQHLISSGASLPIPIVRDMLDMFPNAKIVEAYGWTEGSWVTRETKQKDDLVAGSVGRPAFGSHVIIVDAQGKPCATGTAGEIAALSPTTFSHYLNQPQESAANWRSDGYLLSGDIGMLLEDGRLVVLDRRADMIVTGGENVYSAEVERALAACPGVRESVVVGRPDPKWGQAVTAVVALEPDANINEEGIRSFCRTQLAGYKCPKKVWFTDELPRNQMGKVEKFRVRKMLETWESQQHESA